MADNPSESTLVIIPTYNESENLPRIVERVRAATPEVDILVVDDNSPDGTGDIADEIAGRDDQVHVLHRTEKNGLLGAYIAGFNWGLERDYQVLCQMDADGSHAPEQLHYLLEQVDDGADLVIGSRYVQGGKAENWPRERYLLSKAGNMYISLALGGDVADMTAGYRAFRRDVLEAIDLDSLSRKGYIFQVQLADKAIQEGFDVREVPITFVDREFGESKLDASFATQSLAEVSKWGLERRTNQASEIVSELARLGKYELRQFDFGRVPRALKHYAWQGVEMAKEGARLTAYEIERDKEEAELKTDGSLKHAAQTAAGVAGEGVRLLRYEIGRLAQNR